MGHMEVSRYGVILAIPSAVLKAQVVVVVLAASLSNPAGKLVQVYRTSTAMETVRCPMSQPMLIPQPDIQSIALLPHQDALQLAGSLLGVQAQLPLSGLE